jgi:CRP-like cAMP-binding protein
MAIAEDQLRDNLLLAALPADDQRAVCAVAERVELDVRQMLHEVAEPLRDVFFPIDAVCSLLSGSDRDRSVEIATVGREGFVGVPILLQGGFTSEHRAMVQIAGHALRLDVGDFQRLVAEHPVLATMLYRFTLALLAQIAQGSACNRLHSLQERCARWLLMTHDRVRRDQFPLTQEFLAQMLGVRRAGVNEAQQALSADGLISYVRGTVTVLDRAGLEARACDCYALIRGEHDRLAGFDPAAPPG